MNVYNYLLEIYLYLTPEIYGNHSVNMTCYLKTKKFKVRVNISVLIITACINGTYGKDCMYNCTDMCPNGDFCNNIDGSCSDECSSECNEQRNSRFFACDLTNTP